MDKFMRFRKDYPIFEYNSYKITEREDKIEVQYEFNIPGLTSFCPKWEFPKPNKNISMNSYKIFERVIFNLGMVEVISYLKSTCSPKLIVKAGYLNDEQIAWYKKLYINGLGEFFYVNNIASAMNEKTFLDIYVQTHEQENILENDLCLTGNLIPVGGGKDSAVTLEVLSDEKDKNTCFVINIKEASYNCAKIAGYDDHDIYTPKRILDKKIIELNNQGFFNGHTPFSAIVAFSSYASAILLGRKYIVLSNEDSANESNVADTNINHQYSKSIEFENDFRNYYNKFICNNGPEYFSLLRPISEWQIVKAFTKSSKYFPVFKSCNVGSKGEFWHWCEDCPKCLYVYIMLAAFLDIEDMKKIFKTDMLDNEELEKIFNGLVYPDYDKPFECVGTKDEINLSISMIVKKYIQKNMKLPKLLEKYNYNEKDLAERFKDITQKWNRENNLPEKFKEKLQKYIK